MSRDPEQLARLLKVLSVGTRVRIVQLLKGRTLCVNALSAKLDVTQGAVSQHLRVLRDAGLLVDDKRGCFVHYRMNEKTLAAWRGSIDKLLAPPEGSRSCRKGTTPCPAANKKRAARRRRI
jgi:DNA-binding transcriptional ArsR family regulator